MPRKTNPAETEITAAAAPKKRAARKTADETAAPKTKRVRAAAATHKTRAAHAGPVFSPDLFQEEIARQAYFYWLERGSAHGHHQEDWLRAETEIRRRFAAA